jgi:hypothetical protein
MDLFNELVLFTKSVLVLVGVPGSLIAAWKVIVEFRNSNNEKAKEVAEKAYENRQRQANSARDALEQLFSSQRARSAMQMLDWDGRTYRDGEHEHTIYFRNLGSALRTEHTEFSPTECFIRECFEDFFDKIELMQHFVDVGFLNFDDLSVPIKYYALKIVDNLSIFESFLDNYGYPRAKLFFERAAQWY